MLKSVKRIVGEESLREVREKGVVEKCWGRVFAEKYWSRVL